MKTLYFDCFSGISGDMTIGALLDLGVDFHYLRTEIGRLGLDGVDVGLRRVDRAGIDAAKFDVVVDGAIADPGHDHHEHGPGQDHGHDHGREHEHEHGQGQGHSHGHDHGSDAHAHTHDGPADGHTGGHGQVHTAAHVHRKASAIIAMIRESGLEARVRERAIGIFEKLAISEGRVHNLPPEDVEFHEVGAIDSIVDVVGAAIGLEAIGAERFVASPINIGGGFIHCQHGVYPVPAPATANLLRHAPVYSRHVQKELVTPTGAAILAATIDQFGPIDGLTIERVGYGAGSADLGAFPNCLRLFLAEGGPGATATPDAATVRVIEANIDDMSAEQLAFASERLMDAGALDVVIVPVLMKKGRPGHQLQVLASPEETERMTGILFSETSTIGVRMTTMSRRVLERTVVDVPTPSGTIRVKVAANAGQVSNVSPEYDDCARIARETGRPYPEIREMALRCYRQQSGGEE